MTRTDGTTPPKRLHILNDEEIEALYGRPCLTGDEQFDVFTLTQPEKDLLASFTQVPLQVYFLLQLGYFKAKQLFFPFTFDDVGEDVTYLIERYFPETLRSELRMPNKRTILKQRQQILKLFGYRLCTPTDRQNLFLRAQHAARISSKPIYILRELLHFLTEQRLVKPGYTFLQEELVGKAITAEGKRLATMRREMTRGASLAHLYTVAKRIVPQLDISREGITYYSSLGSYYSVFRLKQLDTWTVYLYLLCFVFHRYQRFNDHLLTCFIHLVKQYADEAKATAKRPWLSTVEPGITICPPPGKCSNSLLPSMNTPHHLRACKSTPLRFSTGNA